MVAFVTIAENMDSPQIGVPIYTIRQYMTNAGFTKIAITLALNSLLNKEFLDVSEDSDFNNNTYVVYHVTDKGMKWLLDNEDKLVLKMDPKSIREEEINLDDLPF